MIVVVGRGVILGSLLGFRRSAWRRRWVRGFSTTSPPCVIHTGRGRWSSPRPEVLRPSLHAGIARAFDDPETTGLPVLDTTDGDHGRVERRRHVVFHEDLNRLGSGHGQQTMATVRPISLDLLGGAEDEHSLEVRRTSAAWDDGDRDAIIRQTA